MKIGILTYHRVINDGSVMQAYCLQKIIEYNFPDADVEIIDYQTSKTYLKELFGIFTKKFPFYKKSKINKINSINSFVNKEIKLSEKSCVTSKLYKAQIFIDNKYDIIFTGSDTVWEARNSKFVTTPPNLYFLPNVDAKLKISFAASADPIHIDFVNKYVNQNDILSCLLDYDYITVRDSMTINYLNEIGISDTNINFMPDPTLLYDFKELVDIPYIKKNKSLAGISLPEKYKKNVFYQLDKLGYDVIDLNYNIYKGEKLEEINKSINKRLGLYSLLDILVTDRFHSSIFMMKLTKSPVIFIENPHKWPHANSKGRDLYNRMGVSSMIYRDDNDIVKNNMIQKYINEWDIVKDNIEKQMNEMKKIYCNQINIIKDIINKMI